MARRRPEVLLLVKSRPALDAPWRAGSGVPVSLLAAIRLVRRLAPGRVSPNPPRMGAVDGIPCDWYEPSRAGGPVVVALHGLTLNGKEDPRLRAFAGALASVGATCVVPTLPALASARWDGGDVTAVARVAAAHRA
jgi:hypothetical protein